jgi:hypothetical protein
MQLYCIFRSQQTFRFRTVWHQVTYYLTLLIKVGKGIMDTTKVRASGVLMVGGLAMVVLGGCFLIGVMLVVTNFYGTLATVTGSECSPTILTPSQQIL